MPPTIKAPREESDREARARVVSVNAETGKPNSKRVLFEGLEADARAFVENNYPRPHIEPGGGDPTPDVVVQTLRENGSVHSTQSFHADSGFADYKAPDNEEGGE